jgi:tetratricopeptide (TPR) repeat protein
MVGCLIAAVFVLALAPGHAWGDPAARLVAKGKAKRRAGDFAAAYEIFGRAHARDPDPRTAAELGRCARALGRWVEAEGHLVEALHARKNEWVRRHRAELRRSLAAVRQQLGHLDVGGRPEGAEVIVGSRRVGTLPLPAAIRVEAGDLELRINAPDHEPLLTFVTVAPGGTERVVVDLERKALVALPAPPLRVDAKKAKAKAAPRVRLAEAKPAPAPASPALSDHAGAAPRGERWQRTAFKVTLGAGVLLAVGGVAAHLQAEKSLQEFEKSGGVNRCDPLLPDMGGGRCPGLRAEGQRFTGMAIAGFAGAASAAAFALMLHGWNAAEERRLTLACNPTLATPGAACALRF